MSEPRFVSNRLISFIDGSGDAKIASSADPLPVDIGSATLNNKTGKVYNIVMTERDI